MVGVCIFVAVQAALPIIPVDRLPKFLGVALLARWLIEMALPNPARRLKSFVAGTTRQFGGGLRGIARVFPGDGALGACPGRHRHRQPLRLNVILFLTIFAARSRDALHWISAAIA